MLDKDKRINSISGSDRTLIIDALVDLNNIKDCVLPKRLESVFYEIAEILYSMQDICSWGFTTEDGDSFRIKNIKEDTK